MTGGSLYALVAVKNSAALAHDADNMYSIKLVQESPIDTHMQGMEFDVYMYSISYNAVGTSVQHPVNVLFR